MLKFTQQANEDLGTNWYAFYDKCEDGFTLIASRTTGMYFCRDYNKKF